ncbi:hypothetical protein HGRIS_001641 [Hohenbuehelia grisea]|uniref:Zn(2)-C6 fungal-type domain-containing protein n=1 Tax=Hohenbuehelia grisea TaxID=104357 RepID=A0ABR3JI17_9AGAR
MTLVPATSDIYILLRRARGFDHIPCQKCNIIGANCDYDQGNCSLCRVNNSTCIWPARDSIDNDLHDESDTYTEEDRDSANDSVVASADDSTTTTGTGTDTEFELPAHSESSANITDISVPSNVVATQIGAPYFTDDDSGALLALDVPVNPSCDALTALSNDPNVPVVQDAELGMDTSTVMCHAICAEDLKGTSTYSTQQSFSSPFSMNSNERIQDHTHYQPNLDPVMIRSSNPVDQSIHNDVNSLVDLPLMTPIDVSFLPLQDNPSLVLFGQRPLVPPLSDISNSLSLFQSTSIAPLMTRDNSLPVIGNIGLPPSMFDISSNPFVSQSVNDYADQSWDSAMAALGFADYQSNANDYQSNAPVSWDNVPTDPSFWMSNFWNLTDESGLYDKSV